MSSAICRKAIPLLLARMKQERHGHRINLAVHSVNNRGRAAVGVHLVGNVGSYGMWARASRKSDAALKYIK